MNTALLAIGAVYTLWVLYLASMNLIRARDAGLLPRPAYVLGLPIVGAGVLLDALVNLTVCTLLFAELPREWLVTARVTRLERGTGWRQVVASWVCHNLLDNFDPSGKHCA
ncbi:MAG: hypothetical protein KGI52_16730 [Burkholderiales bacterium]|nr:hypothetical protein [Burkholderiales bacterium]